MDSYFFVPGTKLYKIDTIEKLGVTAIIIDLEDAVKESNRHVILEELINNTLYKEYYIRIPLYSLNENLDLNILHTLIKAGFTKFVFPKLNSLADFESTFVLFEKLDLKIILLVESPLFFLQVEEVLMKYKSYFSGIGLGSHDFMSVVGGVHTL